MTLQNYSNSYTTTGLIDCALPGCNKYSIFQLKLLYRFDFIRKQASYLICCRVEETIRHLNKYLEVKHKYFKAIISDLFFKVCLSLHF